MTKFYRVRTSIHRNLSNFSMTIGNTPHKMYTDAHGVLRVLNDNEGHPYIPADIAEALKGFPASDGWICTPLADDAPEPDEEVIPVEFSPSGEIQQANSTVTARLMAVLEEKRGLQTLIGLQERRNDELVDELQSLKGELNDWQTRCRQLEDELAAAQDERPALIPPPEDVTPPAAPMVGKGGRLAKPRKNKPTEVLANDASVSTLDMGIEQTDMLDNDMMDDIPHVEG